MFKFIYLLFSIHLQLSFSAEIVTLNGQWYLSDTSKQYTNINATVPGGIYTDLMANGIIGDIFYGYNDINLKWVPRLNWTYYRNFTIPDQVFEKNNINLVFEGLDTISSIFINDREVGESVNMFVQYIFDIKEYLRAGNNYIEVRFSSPVKKAEEIASKQELSYPVPPICPPVEYRGECNVNMIRKMQASFSWDWGPSFPSVGIWKNVYVEAYDESVIRYVVSDVMEKDASNWILNVDVYLANNKKNKVVGTLQLDIDLNFQNITKMIDVNAVPNNNDEVKVTVSIEILKTYVYSWWPNGYGVSKLYQLKTLFRNTNRTDTSLKYQKIGFRKVEIVQDTLESGLTFYFKINDVPIFAKGTNEIPIDVLPERGQNETVIKNLLTAARDSHMNMLRIWGGGVYESDYLYDLADEYGILIWQDFMFACAMYPTTSSYLSNVVEEVRHQVKRLYSHPSIIIYSGNNENEGGLRNNWFGTSDNFTIYYSDYIKLYITTIKTEFMSITNNRGMFVCSSPTNGKESDSENFVATNPYSSLYGDVHFYNYLVDPFDSNIYPVPRFASEYGYQSLPCLQSWLTANKNSAEIDFDGMFIAHRQHNPLGNFEMELLIFYTLPFPDRTKPYFMERMIYYSQIVQALATKIETEHYRRYRSSLNAKGEGYTMGALYWQLNDVWVAPSWSGIDYLGKWKMLQYYTSEFFAPVIVTGHINTLRTLELYVVSDLMVPLTNITVLIQVFRWYSLSPLYTENVTLSIDAGSSNLMKSIQTDEFLSDKGCGSYEDARNYCLFYFSVEKSGAKITPDNFVIPTGIKYANVSSAQVSIKTVKKISDNGIYRVEIASDKVALFVWLESVVVDGRFSENGFVLVEPSRIVDFMSNQNTTESELLNTLTVTSLLDKKYSY